MWKNSRDCLVNQAGLLDQTLKQNQLRSVMTGGGALWGAQWPDFNQIKFELKKKNLIFFFFCVVKSHKWAKEELISCPKFPELHREQHSRRHEQTNLLYECHVTSLLCYDRLISLNVSGSPPMGKFQVPTLKDGRQEFHKKLFQKWGKSIFAKANKWCFYSFANKQNSTPRLQKLIFWIFQNEKYRLTPPTFPTLARLPPPPSPSRPPTPLTLRTPKWWQWKDHGLNIRKWGIIITVCWRLCLLIYVAKHSGRPEVIQERWETIFVQMTRCRHCERRLRVATQVQHLGWSLIMTHARSLQSATQRKNPHVLPVVQ